MQYYPRKKGDYCICQESRLTENAPCSKDKIMMDPINETVLESIRGLIKCGKRFEKRLEKKKDVSGARAEKRLKEIADLQSAVRKCQADLFQNSERLMDGIVDKKTYQANRERLNAEKDKLEQRIKALEAEKDKADIADDPETMELLDAVNKYDGAKELDNEMALAFVEKVLIYSAERVEIRWIFSDKLINAVMKK